MEEDEIIWSNIQTKPYFWLNETDKETETEIEW